MRGQGVAQNIASGKPEANPITLLSSPQKKFPDDLKDRSETPAEVKHELNCGLEEFLERISDEKRASQAKLIDTKLLGD